MVVVLARIVAVVVFGGKDVGVVVHLLSSSLKNALFVKCATRLVILHYTVITVLTNLFKHLLHLHSLPTTPPFQLSLTPHGTLIRQPLTI